MSLPKNITQKLPFPFFVLDSNFTILGVSDEALAQFPKVGDFLDIVDFDSLNKAKRFIKPTVAYSKIELNLVNKQNHVKLFDIHIQWENDNRVYIFCIEKEASIQKIQSLFSKLERQLNQDNLSLQEKQEKMQSALKKMEQVVMQLDNYTNLGKLAPGIANDLQKPLVSVRGFLQLVKPYVREMGKEHYVNIALDELNHANNLIYQFLNATKPTLPEKQKVNIQKMIMELISSLQLKAGRINCEIKYVPEQILPIINLDIKQIKQVFLNIIRNSMDAIQESPNKGKGKIIIHTKLKEHMIEISFQDNGKGMDSETLKKVLTPFFTTKDKETGIGLAVSLNMIQNHGGDIKITSDPNNGSTFTVVLPVKEKE
jgi:signal transduction histidine kinase